MTKEKAKNFLIDISYKFGSMAVEYLTEKDGEKMRDAIKALEQEPILDEIRAEIVYLHDWAFSREEILRIIDKYKTTKSEEYDDK